jgi:uncharacterized cupin superfamily protein
MQVLKYRFDSLMEQAPAPKPVPAPIGDVVSQVRSQSIVPPSQPTSRFGVWQCTPGQWRRQIMQAEYCHLLEGSALFTPDEGEPVRLAAGDIAYFPEGSAGVWEIFETSRKIFILLDEHPSS